MRLGQWRKPGSLANPLEPVESQATKGSEHQQRSENLQAFFWQKQANNSTIRGTNVL